MWTRSSELVFLAGILVFVLACGEESDRSGDSIMHPIAEGYVQLVLALGQHDADYVDAYYGPEEWRERAANEAKSLASIGAEARSLLTDLLALRPRELADELLELRREYLETQLRSLLARAEMLDGKTMTFDEESKALYDAVAPTLPEEHFQEMLDELEELLPGTEALVDRYEAFKRRFIIPPDRLDLVFRAAIEACRSKAAQHLELPEDESFVLEYVEDKPWSGYNWYQGSFRSLIQINTDLPIYIDRAIDLACHEGYPGHHLYHSLLEKHLTLGRGWVEFTVNPLFSPQSLIAEGTANYGIEMAFPGEERLAFEKETLFPLAGLDPDTAALYYGVEKLVERLAYAGNEAARRYLDGKIGAEEAVGWLTRLALMPLERAEQRVRFIDKYRSYVINYNLGRDLVRDHIEAVAGTDPVRRWQEFGKLLASPRLPSGLRGAKPGKQDRELGPSP